VGIALGLGLGVRVSWAPLFVAMIALAPRGERLRATGVATLATLAWAVPFVRMVGLQHLVALARTHAKGHFEVWGGSAINEPGVMRLAWLARDVFVDGLGVGMDVIGVGIGALAVTLACLGLASRPRVGAWLLVPLPYLAWIALGQNLHQQPRHALPMVASVAAALAVAATTGPRARIVGGALLALVAARTALDAHDRRTTPPPGAQLVALARSLPRGVATFAGPSARFFELDPGAGKAPIGINVGTLGDVRLALGRLSPLPSRVLVTSEVEGLAQSTYPLEHVATLCRPPRTDRRAPCLDVFDWKAPFLRR
jgi:hypothetical protein